MTPQLSPVRRRRTTPVQAPRRTCAPRPTRERLAAPAMDRALYECACGNAFRAEVTTSVGCPRCGDGQPW